MFNVWIIKMQFHEFRVPFVRIFSDINLNTGGSNLRSIITIIY